MTPDRNQEVAVLVVFRVGPDLYTVDVREVREVVPTTPATRVPGAPAFLEGVIELRGLVVPVVDLKPRLGYDGRTTGRASRYLVVVVQQRVVAMAVDEVIEVVRVNAANFGPAPELVRQDGARHVVGVVRGRSELTLVLDLASTLSAGEQEALADFEEIPLPEAEADPGKER